jgi:NAD(P)-dependent dehydrogenase (short-subunit alcohol dehydrogenase family)
MGDPNRFKGKVALITGGASGIGLASGIRMGSEGASIGVADINEGNAKKAVKEIEKAGGQALAIKCDVTKTEDNQRMVAETIKAFKKIDILVTCAGVGAGGNVDTIDEEYWDRVLDLDLRAVFLACKYTLPEIRKTGKGAVVHISSIGGLCGMSGASFCAAKAGVVNLTKQMATVYAKENIRTNCICPGVIDTPLVQGWLNHKEGYREEVAAWHPLNRLGVAEEVAAAVAFLCADEASYITGAILPVDGGYMAAGRQR